MPDSREAPWDSRRDASLGTTPENLGTRFAGGRVSPSAEPGVRVWTRLCRAVLRALGRALCSLSLSFSIWERELWAMSRWSGTGLGQVSSGLLLTVRGSTEE